MLRWTHIGLQTILLICVSDGIDLGRERFQIS